MQTVLRRYASVGPETLSRAVAVLGGWGDDARVAGWDGSDALASKLGGGLLRWLSNEASVGGCYSCCAQCV